jgi:hypothetical protein
VSAELDTIITALHERRNRLINLDVNGGATERATPTLRARINEVTDAINFAKALKGGKHV